MYKDELLQLHHLNVCLMKFLRENGAPESYFADYLKMDISPHHIHKTKAEHKTALLCIASGISRALSENSDVVPATLSQRIHRFYIRASKEL